MKKITAIILAALFVTLMLASCGSPVGKYVVKSVDGEDVRGDEDFSEEFFSLELKSNKKAVFTISNVDYEGTWKKDGDKITIKIEWDDDETETLKFTQDGKELKGTFDESKFVFVKK